MIKFYDIDERYIKYLQTFDSKVPNIHYSSNNKFMCGIVLDINGCSYYAPISHSTTKQQTSLIIRDKSKAIASIKFSFMVPAPSNVLTMKSFADIAKVDQCYANLLATEYKYCVANEQDIRKKALSVYNIGCNKNHVLNHVCCDFEKLEKASKNYI